jgi:antitoxin ParD1/3/4
LRLVRKREQDHKAELAELRAEIQKGIDSGPGREIDPKEWAEEIKARGPARLAAEKNGQ